MEKEKVNHPSHYGGKDNPYEAIKVIEAWRLNFNLGNAVKYISRAGKKSAVIEDLQKAKWYLEREIKNINKSDKEFNEDLKQFAGWAKQLTKPIKQLKTKTK